MRKRRPTASASVVGLKHLSPIEALVATSWRRNGLDGLVVIAFSSCTSTAPSVVTVPVAGVLVFTVKYAYRPSPGQTAWRICPLRNTSLARARILTLVPVISVKRHAFPAGAREESVGCTQ